MGGRKKVGEGQKSFLLGERENGLDDFLPEGGGGRGTSLVHKGGRNGKELVIYG